MIDSLFGSKTRVKLLHLFLNNPEKSFYVREITRLIDEQINSVRRELANMVSVGIVQSDNIDNKLYYSTNIGYRYLEPLSVIFSDKRNLQGNDSSKVWAKTLSRMSNIKVIISAGKLVGDTDGKIDLLLVGDISAADAGSLVKKIEKVENNELNYSVMSYEDFYYRLSVRDRFIMDIIEGKHSVLIDTEKYIEKGVRMFDIEYKGANAIVFATKKVRVVFDPNLAVVGAKNVSVKDSVEVVTEDRFAVTDPAPRLLLNGPGEYEVGDVAISGIPARRHIDTGADDKKSTIYKISVGDVRGVVIGNIQPKLSDDQLEDIGVVDFAIIPVGGSGYTLDAVSASSMVRQLDPKVVIPVHYADSSINYEVPQAGVEDFMKELNANVVEAGLKWRLKKPADLPDSLTVVQISKT